MTELVPVLIWAKFSRVSADLYRPENALEKLCCNLLSEKGCSEALSFWQTGGYSAVCVEAGIPALTAAVRGCANKLCRVIRGTRACLRQVSVCCGCQPLQSGAAQTWAGHPELNTNQLCSAVPAPALSSHRTTYICCRVHFHSVFSSSLQIFFSLVFPSPFLSFWLLTQLQTEPVWLYERHFLLLLFYFFNSASAHQLLSISVTHTLAGRAAHNARLNSRNPSEAVRQRLLKADCR